MINRKLLMLCGYHLSLLSTEGIQKSKTVFALVMSFISTLMFRVILGGQNPIEHSTSNLRRHLLYNEKINVKFTLDVLLLKIESFILILKGHVTFLDLSFCLK